MKKRIVLDVLMAVAAVCLLNLNITGTRLHEILGLAVFFLFLLHKLFNLRWIKTVTKGLFKGELKTKTKALYGVDVLLLVLATANVLTGVLISANVLSGVTASNIGAASTLHHVLAYLLFAALTVHVCLHGAFIRKVMKIKNGGAVEKIVISLLSVVITVVLLESNTARRLTERERERDEPPPYHAESSEEEKEEEEASEEEQSEESSVSSADETDGDRPTLEEFLSRLFCTSCGRRCLLTRPACGKGNREQQQAVQRYNETYGTDESYATSGGGKRH